MALSTDQIVAIRRQVGSKPSDDELNEIYDRTADVDDLVLEILETRLADLRRTPAAFSVTGEYSQDTRANIESLEAKVRSLGGDSGSVVFTAPPSPRIR